MQSPIPHSIDSTLHEEGRRLLNRKDELQNSHRNRRLLYPRSLGQTKL